MIARPTQARLPPEATIPAVSDSPAAIDLKSATELDGTDGQFTIELSDRWRLWGPSGGYLSAIALRAAGEISQLARPVSFYCHFLKSPRFETVEVVAQMERAGRRSESISVTMRQDGQPVMKALVRTASESDGHSHHIASIPTDSRPGELKPFRFSGPGSTEYTYWDHFERRLPEQPADSVAAKPRIEWIRSTPIASFENPFLDAARPLMMLDTFGYLGALENYEQPLFAPNLDTSAWFHDIDAQTDWLMIEHVNPVARDGILFVDGNVWSEDGVLVASGSAQLLQLPTD